MRHLYLAESRPLRYVTFFYLYLMQGLPAGFSLTALANYLAAEGVRPAVIGSFVATAGLPWAGQFVWGPLIDRFQESPMGRRRPWVLGAQVLAVLASLGLLFVADPVAQVGALGAAFFVHSVFASVQDASVDALAIGIIPETERGRVNAFMRGGFLTGIGAGAALFAWLLREEGYRVAALALSAVLLGFTVLTFFIRERPGDALLPGQAPPPQWGAADDEKTSPTGAGGSSFRALFGQLLASFFSRRSLRLFVPIWAVYLSLSVFIRAFSVHLIQKLGWRDTELSLFSGVYGTLIALTVIFIGGLLADRLGARRLLVGVMLGIGVYLLIFNGLSPFWPGSTLPQAGLTLWYTFDPVVSVAAMPALMAVCRPGLEGSQFTTYMALVNLSEIAGSFVAGHAQEVVSAPVLGLGCGAVLMAAAGVVWRDNRRRTSAPVTRFGTGSTMPS